MTPTQQPLLPSSYSLWFDPPDERGDEVLHVNSDRRAVRLKGRAFREFCSLVVPLLDGRHTVAEIEAATTATFEANDLRACLELLERHGVIVEGGANAVPDGARQRMTPQINFLHGQAPNLNVQSSLASATVAVIGLGGAGFTTALGLAASGIGTVRVIDPHPVAPADVYLAPGIGLGQVGMSRTSVAVQAMRASAPEVTSVGDERPLESEDDLRRAVDGAHYVVCCLDQGQSNLLFKLNRVCWTAGVRWVACNVSGAEILVGPAVHPDLSACYMCYRMRSIACAGNPEEAFAYERFLDRRKSDDSGTRENLVFGAGLAANFLGLEVVRELTAIAEPALVGRLLSVRLTDLLIQRHTVLRKPWCPACSADGTASVG